LLFWYCLFSFEQRFIFIYTGCTARLLPSFIGRCSSWSHLPSFLWVVGEVSRYTLYIIHFYIILWILRFPCNHFVFASLVNTEYRNFRCSVFRTQRITEKTRHNANAVTYDCGFLSVEVVRTFVVLWWKRDSFLVNKNAQCVWTINVLLNRSLSKITTTLMEVLVWYFPSI